MPQSAKTKVYELDGQRYEFPADVSEDQVKETLAKETKPKPTPPATFKERFVSSSGIPTSLTSLKDAGKMFVSPAGPTARHAYKAAATEYGTGLKQAADEGSHDILDSVRNIREGGPVLPNLGKAAYGFEHTLAAAFGPPGQAVESFGEDIHSGNYKAAAGTATGLATQAGLTKLFEGAGEKGRVDNLAYATHADREDLARAFPDIKNTSKGTPPRTLPQLQSVVDKSLRTVDDEFNAAFHPIRGQRYVPVEIYNSIRSQIKSHMLNTPAGRSIVNALNRRSVDFAKPWTMEDLNQERMDAYARLRALRKSEAAGQRASLRTKADAMVDEAILRETRDIIYTKMDQVHGKPDGYYSDLKQRQSALLGVKDDMADHAKEVVEKSARKRGAPFMERGGISTYAHPTGGGGVSLHRAHELFSTPEKTANKQVGKAFTSTPGAKVSAGVRKAGKAGAYSYPARVLGVAAANRDRKSRDLPSLGSEDEDEQ